jgi:hypothetical protein
VVNALHKYDDDILKTHVLRDFLRAVRDHAGPDDLPVLAATKLIDVDSHNFTKLSVREGFAGGILKESGRNVRRLENRQELIAALADAVIDFVKDPAAIEEFDRKESAWIIRQMPAPRSDGKIINALGHLLTSDDPVDGAFLSRLTLGRADEKAWRRHMHIYYRLREILNTLSKELEKAIDRDAKITE